MGSVYEADHSDSGQRVALKVVRVASRDSVQGIRREIHALRRVHHPGVVRILDEGLHEGLPWYAMELCEGVSLRRYFGITAGAQSTLRLGATGDAQATPVAGSPAPTPHGPELHLRLTVIRRLCAPLSFLHGLGMVHRDLKPDNVLVRPDGVPVLVDFGLSTSFAGEVSREHLEVAGTVAGTAGYMAPEQARGEVADARADLYALGCILYEVVSGAPPFVGDPVKVMFQHMNEKPAPPSWHAPGLSVDLEALILRLLQKEPRDRLGHADDVAAELLRLGAFPDPREQERPPRPRPYLYRAALAGRGDELRDLETRLVRLQRGGGGMTLIGGESGAGKTRLAAELAAKAVAAAIEVLTGQCEAPRSAEAHGGASLLALRRPLQTIADRCREAGERECEHVLGPRGRVLAPYEPALAALPGQSAHPDPPELPPEAARLRVFRSLAQTLVALTTWEPCLLLLDDLQWADELTLGFLFHLLRAGTLSESKLLVVATFRSDEMGPALRELLAAESVTHVHLGRLPERAIADMVCDMLAVDAAPPFVPSIVRLSEGNPFYVAEYLRTTIALGFLRRDVAGRWQSSADSRFDPAYASLPLPGSVKELVSEHLLGLDPRTRRVLDMAAVLGREIPGELLEAAWGGDGSEVLEAVQELLSRQVIEEQGSLLRFAHDRTREVAYQALGAQERRALHRKAAEVIARSFPAQATTEPGTLAHHWEEAGEPLLARPHYLAGARLALTRHDLVEAEKLYVRHLALFAEPTAGAVSARNELGERVLQMSGRERQALDEHRRALDEARSLGDASLEARSRSGLARASAATGNPQEAIELYEEALRLSGGGVDPAEEARAALGLADVRRDRGDREIADGLYRTVLERHEAANDHAGIGRLLGKLAGLDLMAGRVTDAEALFRRALELHRTCGESREEAITLSNLAGVLLGRGRLDEAIELNRRALAIYGIVGDRRLEGLTVMNLAVVHYNRGEYEEAGRLHAQALEVARETGDLRWEGIALSYVAGVHEVTARPNDAIECYERALQILERVGDRRFQSLASINLAGVLLGLGRNDEARRRTEEGLALMDALGDERSKPFALRQLAVVELHAGLADRALDLLDAACERFREIAELLPLSDTLIYQAKVARIARGDIARARLLVARARAALDELGDPTHASQRASCDAEEAFVDLAGGGTADAALARLRAAGDSGRARDLAALIEECLAARKAGQPLVHGQLPHQLEPSLRRFLAGS